MGPDRAPARALGGAARPRVRRPSATGALIALAALAVSVAGPVTDAAAAPSAPLVASPVPVGGSGPLDQQVTDARRAAAGAARRVDALRQQYLELTDQAAQAADRLAGAFAEQSLLDGRHDADAAALARARTVRGASIREVYTGGGRLGLMMSVLSAGSPDDALWRLATAHRVEAAALVGLDREADRTAVAEADSAAQVSAAAAADTDLARALAELQNDAAAADTVLQQARAELDRLDAQAKQLAEAREAALRLARAQAQAQAARLRASAVSALTIPPEYEATYRAAAGTCPGVDWTLLAAVGQIESGHGRNNGPSSAGAVGPMQFMPATFAQYAVDGDGDGSTDPWDYRDATFTAAAYLCASGAQGGSVDGVRKALFAYNHAQWYVDLVLAAQQAILARPPS